MHVLGQMNTIIIPLLVIAGGTLVWSNQAAVEILRSPTKVVVLKPDPIPVVKFQNTTNATSETIDTAFNNFVNSTNNSSEAKVSDDNNIANETSSLTGTKPTDTNVTNETNVSRKGEVPVEVNLSNETYASNHSHFSNETLTKESNHTYDLQLNELLANVTSDEVVDVVVTGNDDGSVTVQEVGSGINSTITFNHTDDLDVPPVTPPCIRRDYEDSAAAIFMEKGGPIETAYLIFNSSMPLSDENMLNSTLVSHLTLLNETIVDCTLYFDAATATRRLSAFAVASLAG